jgi:predicted transcriptional regulator
MMKEHEARRAILKRTDLNNADKVVMMAVLMTMDWKTWTNRTTHSALAKMTGRNRGNINKNIKRLEELGLINRDWWTSENRCKSPMMKVVKEALEGEETKETPRSDRGKSRPFPQETEVLPKETEVLPKETEVLPKETEVFPQETSGVSLEQHISTNYNQLIPQPKINPWGVPNDQLWGDHLRGGKDEESK